GERYRHAQSVDGARLGRSDAAHRQPAVAFWQAIRPGSFYLWDSVERRRGIVSCIRGQPLGGFTRNLHTSLVFDCLYSAKAEDPAMHFGRGFSRRNASSDRLGRSFCEYRPKRLVLVRYRISLAVSTFPRNCLDVPERLRAGGL